MNEELIQILKDYVATANNPKYEGDWNVIDSKFPELSNYDKQLLKDYVATANNPSYGGDWSVVNSKFPELFEEVKKKETSEVSSQEEPLASPMETPTLASLPGRDATLPPSPTLAPQLAQTLERIAPMDKVEAEVAMTTGAAFEQPAPTQEQFPVPYETRPAEVTTEDGLTLDLETAGISGETGVTPEAMDVMQERIATGAVAMPEGEIGDLSTEEYAAKLDREKIEGLKRTYDAIQPLGKEVGLGLLANSGAQLLSMLYPSGLPGSEFVDKTAAQMNQALLERFGLSPGDTQKGFTEQSSVKNSAIKLGVDVVNAMGLSALGGTLMAGPAIGVGTAETFGLGMQASSAAPIALLQNAMKTVSGNIANNPLNFGLMGYVGANTGWKEVADNPNMSTEEKVAYSTFAGIKEMLTESGFVGDFRAWNESLSAAERAVAKNSFKEVIKDYVKTVGKQGLEEGTEEGISWSGDLIWNLLSGQELPTARSAWEAMAIGAVAPAGAVTSQYAPSIIDYAAGALPYTLPKSEKLVRLSELKAASAKIKEDLQEEGLSVSEKRKLNQAQRQIDKQIYDLRQEAVESRKNMSEQDRKDLAIIDARIEGLYGDFEKAKTGSAKSIIKQEVKSLLNEKRKIEEDAVQKQTAGEVPVQPEAAVGEEVAEGAPQAEPQVASEEVVVQEEVSPAVQEIEARREKEIEERELNRLLPLNFLVDDTAEGRRIQEEREQLDADLQELNARYDAEIAALGETTPVAQPAVGEEVAEGAPQAEPQVAPEAGAEEEVVLTPQEEAEKQRLAETISAPTKAKADIETITRETISTGRKVADNVVVNEVGAEGKPSKPSITERVAVRAGKAIKRLFPDVNIVLHATADEYVRHAQDAVATEKGEYNPNTNTIHINLATADATTVAHEVFHAVFINRLKTDKKTREVARQMIAAVRKSLPKDSELAKEIDDFAQNYDENFQDEERLAQLVGILAKSYANLKPTAKEQVIDFIKRLAKSLRISLPKNFGTTDKSVMDMLDVMARKVATGRQLMEEDISFIQEGASGNIGNPTTLVTPAVKPRKQVNFPKEPLALSYVTEKDKIDFMALVNDIIAKKQKVWFWMADQLGRGEYYDVTSGIMHYLDAGPSFALDPENRKAGVLWASGLAKQTLERNAAEADYIFFISGSPEKAKLFNKNIISVIGTRIEGNGGFAAFKEEVLATSKVGALNAILNSVNSVEELRESPKRKAFLNLILEQQSKKTPLVDVLRKYDAFFDPNEFRDGFYAENGFGMKDVLLVGKPTGVGGRANHSTYETEILGEVVGVPDVVVDSWTLMPEALRNKYDKELSDAQQMKTIAGDTGIVRRVETLEKKETDEDSLPIAELTDNQKAALDEFDAKKKPAVRKQKAVSNEEARASLKKKLQKLFPTDTDDALTPDELRVFFMENDFEYIKGESGIGSYEQTAKVLMDMASQEGVYLFPSFSLRNAFMFADLANGGETIDMNIMLSPGLLQGPDGMQGDYVDVQAIEALNPGDRGSGAGTRLMNRLVDSADNVGAKLRLEAYPTKRYQVDPVTKKKISQSALKKTARRLVGFYKRFGFSPYGRTKYNDFQQMRREPLEPGGRTASIRKQKGLITLTENDVQKYSRLGIEDKYTARAYDYVLENNPEIVRALEKEAKEQGAKLPESSKINFSVMKALGEYYKGLDNLLEEAVVGLDYLKEYLENNPTFKNIILNEDGPHITKAIQNEISELEKRGAPLSLLEKAEGALSDASLRARYMEKIIDAQRVTISEWKFWARMSSLPEGFKYLLLEAVMTHNYDANLGKFQKRTSRTIRNLMPFDEGAVAQLAMSESDNLLKDYVEILIENSKNVIDAHTIKTDKDGGKWLKFDGEKTNPDTLKVEATALAQLVADTPWCTKDDAYSQLQGGDFYVYVTGPDSNGKFSPRIAVRMYEDRIGEVRGVASGSQDIETDMLPIAEDFMKNELANNGGQRYLDSILYNKLVLMMREKLKSEKLTELLVIDINRVIQDERKYSVDYGENGNVERLKRDLKKKLSNPNELSDELSVEVDGKKRSTVANGYRELRPWTKILVQGNVHESDLDIDQGLKASDLNGITTLIGDFVATDELPVLPNLTRVIGNVYIVSGPGNLMNIKEITGTLKIGDGANVIKFGSLGNNIESVGGLTIGFNADIESLGSLQFINGGISMPVVKHEAIVFQGLKDLGQLKSIEGSRDNRILMHDSVEKIEGLEYVGGDLSLKGENIKSLGSIKTITGDLNGDFNPKFESLGELEEVGALNINFDYLTSLGNLKRITNGGLDIRSKYRLQTLGDLEYVGGDLTIRKTIDLGNLKEVNGDLVIDADIQSLGQLESVAGDLEFERITDGPLGPVDLGNLKTVGRDLIFDPYRLKSFGKLESVKGNLKLKSFRDENVKLPPIKLESVGSLEIKSLSGFFEIPSIEINNFTGIGPDGFIYLDNIKGLKTLITSDKKIDIPANVEIVNCPDLESFGDIRSIDGYLEVEYHAEKLTSLGNIEKIGRSITGFPSLIDLGKLSVFNSRMWEFYDNREGEEVKQVWNDAIGIMETIGVPITFTPEEMAPIILSKTSEDLINRREGELWQRRLPESIFGQLLKLNAQNVDMILGDTDSPVVAVRKQKMTRREIEERNFNAPPQSAAQELGHMYNMNSKGFIPKTSDPSFFKRAVERLSGRLSTKKYHDERTGEFVGYSMTLDGKFFNPFYKVMGDERKPRAIRKQQFSATSNIYDIVTQAREARFTDRVIAAFLKERGYTATEIKEALAVPIDVFGAALPAGFANVEGGVAVGQDLFDSIMKKLKRYANAKRLGILLHTAAEVRMKAQELLLESEVFKKQSPAVQAEMQLGLDSALGIRAAQKKFQADFKALRAMLVNIRKGAAEMDKAKKAMRLFIRKNIPQSQYSKSDVSKLMKAIADSTPDTLPAVMERVTGFVNEFYVRDLQKAIAKLLETKTTTTRAGRRVGRMSVEAQNALGQLNSKEKPMLASEDMSPQQVEDMMKEQLKEFNELSSKTSLTESESARLSVLSLAMLYNESHLMEDNDPRKVEALNMVSQNLKSIIATGRAQMRNELDAQREYYNTLISEAFEGVTGEQLDLSPEGEEANKNRLRELKNKEERKKVFNGKLKTFAGKVGAIVNDYFTKQMDLALLMQRISSGVSGLLSTNLEEIFVNRLFLARESYVNGKKEVLSMVESKAKQIWGDNYNVEMQRNAVPVASSDIVNDKNVIWLNQEKADSLKKEYASADKSRKKQIIKELEALEVVLSNNEAYYLYNQYKDPANAASFEKKYGADYPRIMQQIEARLDKKTKEWADWQVNVLYPSLYERYNEAYRAIYRTNMPWNEFYAGRIYREGAEGDVVFDLLQGTGEYQTSVGGQSTKLRVKNARPVADMDGNAVLNSYLKDMEYFRAYAEPMRDISKVLDNANVKAAIIDVAGKNTYDALKDMMQKVAKKGVHQNESVAANKLMGNFIKSKLGLNPTVFLKQLTSSLAFADYIGFRNWTKYTALALPQAKQLWKEWYNNSPILQDRYESSDIGDVLEGYTYEGAVKESPLLIDTKVFGKDIVLSQKNIRDAMNALMYLVRQGDKGGVMGGLANYLYYKEEFLKKNPGDEQGAARYAAVKATKQAITTQQDSGITNKDWYQTGGPAYRFLNVFLSSPKALFRKEMSAVMSLYRKIKGLPTEDGYQDIARRVITYHVLVPMFFQWVALGLPGLLADWDDEDEDALGRAAIMGNLNALFIIGDLFVGVKDLIEGNPWAGEFKTLPVFEQASIVVQDIKRYSTAKTPEKKDKYFWRAINHMAEFTGVPASNIAKFMKNIEEIANGVSDPGEAILRLFNYSDYVIGGGEKEKKSGSAMSEIDKKLLEARSIK
jgi:GNAT superfamily N-acetyltransferase